jgi:hypothetical protein
MRERSRKDFEGLVNEDPNVALYSMRSGDRSTDSPIVIGARFRMSVLGAARNPRLDKRNIQYGKHINAICTNY